MAFGQAIPRNQRIDFEGYRVTSTSDRLIDGLVEDLEEVRPLPRLRMAFAVILALWAMLLGLVLWTREGDAGIASLLANRIYFVSFAGLLVASLGATISALAAGVPGREIPELGGMLVSLIGLLAAAVACLVGMNDLGLSAGPSPAGIDAMCFREGTFFSLLPAGVILSFLVRGWATHPVRAALVALLGSGALGALIVHASCGFIAPRHILMGHLSVPIALVLIGIYPLAVILNRVRR
jgi:hypothetical protein